MRMEEQEEKWIATKGRKKNMLRKKSSFKNKKKNLRYKKNINNRSIKNYKILLKWDPLQEKIINIDEKVRQKILRRDTYEII